MIARLEGLGTLSVVDDAALYQYCLLFSETEARAIRQSRIDEQAARLESQIPDDVTGSDRAACVRAVIDLIRTAASYDAKLRQDRMALRQYLVEFGLTPAARSRVKVPAKPQQSKVEQFLARRGAGA